MFLVEMLVTNSSAQVSIQYLSSNDNEDRTQIVALTLIRRLNKIEYFFKLDNNVTGFAHFRTISFLRHKWYFSKINTRRIQRK